MTGPPGRTASAGFHEPVMVDEVFRFLAPGPGRVIVDGTLGGGGHAAAALSWAGSGGEGIKLLVGIDRDPEAIGEAGARLAPFSGRVRIRQGEFERLNEILCEEGIDKVDGVLLDLGVSRHQLTAPERGFSLMSDGPLDMRMDPGSGECAAELLLRLGESELSRLIREFGEERFARRIARAVVERRDSGRPVRTTRELAELIERTVPGRRERIHPATRTFMALRIAVNRELERLKKALAELPEALAPGGRTVVISYHSLEDRLVKRSFVEQSRSCVCPPGLPECVCGTRPRLQVLTRRPARPSVEETAKNPAARSARLRAALRLEDEL